MSNYNAGGTSRKTKSLQLFSVLVLLGIYLVGTFEVSSLHTLFHDPVAEQELHSEVNEKNSCHQVLYHNAQEKECEHPTHIAAIKKCSLCQLSIQSFHFFDSQTTQQVNFFTENELPFAPTFELGKACLHLSPRAPPIG